MEIQDNNIIDKQKYMLETVKNIVKHHKELTYVKGELFNIYDILDVTTKEVRTHSAFIAELLNIKGSHLMENVFLKAFISILPKNFENYLDIDTTTVSTEYFMGIINKENKTGGRIDILLKDGNGVTISIENKIDANDQINQIERYYNYNKNKNKVIYLSKFGDEPGEESKGELNVDEHFYVISYDNHIIKWLETCQKIAYDQPILRESIKQYKILIQRITHTLGRQQDQELDTVVVNNLKEASLIASKYEKIVKKIRNDFRNKVVDILRNEIKEYKIKMYKNVSQKFASIFLSNEISDKKLGIESFSGSGILNGNLFVGVFSKEGMELGNEYNSLNKLWVHHQVLRYENEDVNLSDDTFLQKISSQKKLEIVASDISNQIISFLEENEHLFQT